MAVLSLQQVFSVVAHDHRDDAKQKQKTLQRSRYILETNVECSEKRGKKEKYLFGAGV